MSLLLQNLGVFFSYALIAMFVQNTVFTRGLGVSRLTKLVGDSTVDSIIFCVLLTLINVICAPLGYFSGRLLEQPSIWFRDYIRPLVYVVCAIIAFFLVVLLITLVRPPNQRDMLAVLPMATLNTAVLGPMLVTASQNLDFVQTMGFAVGSGLGYAFAVLIVSEGERKMSGRTVPSIFRGLPIKLIYIGILAMAIYGLTGHRLAN